LKKWVPEATVFLRNHDLSAPCNRGLKNESIENKVLVWVRELT